MIKILIDEVQCLVYKNTTIIQACLILKKKLDASDNDDKSLPRFCFHQELEIAGNCRMCLVELVKSPKPVVACALQVNDNMIIKTDTVLVKKAREGVLEFFLINHPLDCPVCDQGGECDLQDQVDVFGVDKSRFNEYKRAIVYKSCSPFVKMIMTRCIHCTRCIRFLVDIAGVHNFCLTGRGNNMEVGTFIFKNLKSELSGNVTDLCPVGALTSKATTYQFRYWELTKKETIDILDNMGADIRVDLRGTKIMRILPRLNKEVNNNWITDLTRYSFDSLALQRFIHPYYRKKKILKQNSILLHTNWSDILDKFWTHFYINKIILKKQLNFSLISGHFSDIYTGIAIKNLSNVLGSSYHESRFEDNRYLNLDFRQNYLLNLNKIDFNNINLFILLGVNLRFDAPLFNIKIRKLIKKKKILIISFSNTINLLYYVKHVTINIKNFLKFLEGKHYLTNYIVNNLQKDYSDLSSFFFIGSSILRRNDSSSIIDAVTNYISFFNKKSSYGVIQTNIGRITTSELGLSKGISNYNNNQSLQNDKARYLFKNPIKYSILFACDDYKEWNLLKNKENVFNIYIGSQSFDFTNFMHIVLPATHHFEKTSYYLNLEGSVRKGEEILNLLEQTQYDWRITFLLYLKIIKSFNYLKYFTFLSYDSFLKSNYYFINFFFFYKKEIWLNKLKNIMLYFNETKFNFRLKKFKKINKNSFWSNYKYILKDEVSLFLLLIYFFIKKNNLFFLYWKNKHINYLICHNTNNNYSLFFLYTYLKRCLNLKKYYLCINNINIDILNCLNFFINKLLMSIKNLIFFNKKINSNLFKIYSTYGNINNKNTNNNLNINKFNKSIFKTNIVHKFSLFYDNKIIFNFLFKYYFINIFSIINKNLYNIKNIYFSNVNFYLFLLLFINKTICNMSFNKNFGNLYLFKLINVNNYKIFNQVFINFYFKDYKYHSLKGHSLYFVDNIEFELFEHLKMYTSIFKSKNQYFCLYNKMYSIHALNNLNTLKKKQIFLNNYPIISYIDNYLESNKVSSLSVMIKSKVNIRRFKIYFSNYL